MHTMQVLDAVASASRPVGGARPGRMRRPSATGTKAFGKTIMPSGDPVKLADNALRIEGRRGR